jgi:toxin YhaV
MISGWTIFAHPLFLNQVNTLLKEVDRLKQKDHSTYQHKNATKRLAAIYKLAFNIIPSDPSMAIYRQGNTLGSERKHWLRAKFFQQYRLFFRYHEASKLIVYAWVNDEGSKRAFESKDDAYRVFSAMLKQGRPPDNWDALLQESRAHSKGLQKLMGRG